MTPRSTLFSILVFLMPLSLFAQPVPAHLQEVFNALKDKPANYRTSGTICENVAAVEMKQKYPPTKFYVTTGVEYEVGDGILGELDLVILNLETQRIELLAEVKCWQDFDAAMRKAQDQRERFLSNLKAHPESITFKPQYPEQQFTSENFSSIANYYFIAQKGSTQKGFDWEISYSAEDLDILQDALMKCQGKKHKCD